MDSKDKSRKLGITNAKIREFDHLIITNAGLPFESIGGVNFINGTYSPTKSNGGKMGFEKSVLLGGFTYKTTVTWNTDFKCWIISFLGGPEYRHPVDAVSNINFNGYVIEPGDVIYSPAYQYISFSDTVTPDLAKNWVRSFQSGTISTPKLSLKDKYSAFEYIETPDQDGVFDLKSVNGKADWFESIEFNCPPFITAIEDMGNNELAINFVRQGNYCDNPSAMFLQTSTNKINWQNDSGSWASPRIVSKPSVKTYYRAFFYTDENGPVSGPVSNTVEFDPSQSQNAPEEEPKSCTPYITSVARNGNNTLGVSFTTLNSDCHVPVASVIESSVDQVTWSSNSGGFISPRSIYLPSVNTYYRIKLLYSPYPESEYSNTVMYDVNTPVPPGVQICCQPNLIQIINSFLDPSLILVDFSLGNGGNCLPVTSVILESSINGGATWTAANGPINAPWTVSKPTVTTIFRIVSVCGLSGNSLVSNTITYTP